MEETKRESLKCNFLSERKKKLLIQFPGSGAIVVANVGGIVVVSTCSV